MVLVWKYFRVVRRGGLATDALIMCCEGFPNKEIYATKSMVCITEEVPEEDLFYLEINSFDSYVASALLPLEEGLYRFIYKEDEDTLLSILPSVIHGISVMEAVISTLCREGVAFDYDNNPTPENVMQSGDVLPPPSLLTFGFYGIYPWRQIGNFPVGRSKLKITPTLRIQHMSCLNFFVKLYFL